MRDNPMPSFRDKARFEDAVAGKSTDKALQVDVDGKLYWIPQSQIDDDSEVWKKGDRGELVVSEWIATQKGLV